MPRTQEDLDREEEEYRVQRDQIIDSAVDKTFKKLADFLKNEGLVLTNKEQVKTKEDHKGNK